jgi:hypothetical protein
MIRLTYPASVLAAILAMTACTSYYDPPPNARAQPAAVALAPAARTGIIESISLVSVPASASGGGTLPAVTSGPYRVTLRMDDRTVQTIQIDDRAFLVGDRVQIMQDGKLNRL